MKAKRNYIIYGLMLAAFAALLLWIVHLGHAYDGLGPGAAPSGEDSPVGLLYDTLTINLKHPLSLLLLQVIAILITVRIFSYLFKYLGQPGVIPRRSLFCSIPIRSFRSISSARSAWCSLCS